MVNTDGTTMKALGPLVVAVTIIEGCGAAQPLETVTAIVTAPLTAPIMIFEARRNDQEAWLERSRRNDRVWPPLDEASRAIAQAALEQVLEDGTIGQTVGWHNTHEHSGPTGGTLTVLATWRSPDAKQCRELLVERHLTRKTTDQRVRTYCRENGGWRARAGPM